MNLVIAICCLLTGCDQFKATLPDTAPGSAYSNIQQTENGFFMIWYEGNEHIVMSEFTLVGWTAKDTIVTSNRFFKNWADLPQIFHGGGDTLVVSWLEISGAGANDYDVKVSASVDRGKTWTDPVIPHRDGMKGEHGFVSFFKIFNNIGMVWLDSRGMSADEHNNGGGNMRLYTTTIGMNGDLGAEIMLDERVCECCPTAAINSGAGPAVAYRDRDLDETRNIQLAYLNGIQPSFPVNNDGWIVPGCPVNGPALAARNEKVAIAWYTAPDNRPQINVSFSVDGGLTFAQPIKIDDGKAIGRTDLLWLNDEQVLVSWLEEGESTGKLLLKSIDISGKIELLKEFDVSAGRGSGYPKLANVGDHIFIVWTEPGENGGIRSVWIDAKS